MDVKLIRMYDEDGTNGTIYIDGQKVCHSIELPWRENERRISCIPEGTYPMRKRNSKKYKEHLEIPDVENRAAILIHCANNAEKELRGCIAPVTSLTAPGLGSQSRLAFDQLKALVYPELERGVPVQIIIKSQKS